MLNGLGNTTQKHFLPPKQARYIENIYYMENGYFMHHRLVEIKKQIGKFIANFSVTAEDGKEYIFDGDVIREGLEISTYDENGDIKPLEDGEYTIMGVKVVIVEGKVSELPEKDSKIEMNEKNSDDEGNGESENSEDSEGDKGEGERPMGNTNDADGRIAELTAQVETLQAENEALRAELAELKAVPMAEPVPQRTNMSTQVGDEVPDHIKGTKYEKAYKVFNSKNN